MKRVFAFGFLIAAVVCDSLQGMIEQPPLVLATQVNLTELSPKAKGYINDRLIRGSFNDPVCVEELYSLFEGMASAEIDAIFTSARDETFKVMAYIFEGNANYAVQHVLKRKPLSKAGAFFWTFLGRDCRTLRFTGKLAGIEAPLTIQNYFRPLLNKYNDTQSPLDQVSLYSLNDDQKKILIGMFSAILSNIYSYSISFAGYACRSIDAFRIQHPESRDSQDIWNPYTDFNHAKVKLSYEGEMMSLSSAKRKFFEQLTRMFDAPTESTPDNGLRYLVRQLLGI